MQLDGLSLFASAAELHALLSGGRIERIAQPTRQTVVFTIRADGHNHRLLVSCEPEASRALLVDQTDKGPDRPYTFLMILRKHLVHARIVSIAAPRCDRVLHIACDALDELGARVRLTFVAELMGKHSNLILINEENVILDCAKRIPPSLSSLRTVLPGDRYQAPPVQQKRDLLTVSQANCVAALSHVATGSLQSALVSLFYGVSPFAARDLCARVQADADTYAPFPAALCAQLTAELLILQRKLARLDLAPCVLVDGAGTPQGFFPFVPAEGRYEPAESLQQAMNAYYQYQQLNKAIGRQRGQLTSAVQTRLQKLYKRLQIQTDTQAKSESFERVRTEGELILAYAYQIPPHQSKIELYDYTQDAPVTLSYDPQLSAQENAQKRFKRYQKLKSASEAAARQIEQIRPEIEYLEDVLFSIHQSETLDQLLEIRHELQDQDILPLPKEQGQKRRAVQSQPLRFVSTDGIELLCGRNNAQNDLVTLRLSRSTDTWLHAQGMPGSHVLVRACPVPPDTLRQAAHIAAFYSKGRRSENVPIDYTLIKHVRKPSGAKPGFVTYAFQKTLFITPDEALVKSLFARDDRPQK